MGGVESGTGWAAAVGTMSITRASNIKSGPALTRTALFKDSEPLISIIRIRIPASFDIALSRTTSATKSIDILL
ncbi:MAG: hypothetical protein C4534_11265 [Gaiellales bacterium]|nr:MAG: hypothetical protein C4534_11265 [Gaiellales bacterium]